MEISTLVDMKIIVDKTVLGLLWAVLNEQVDRPKSAPAIKLMEKIARTGWGLRSDIEDLLYFQDNRLNGYKLDLVELSKLIGIRWQRVCFRPRINSNYVSEYDALRVEDAALLLIKLEGMGFQTDAAWLVNVLLPDIKSRKKKIFSDAELEIFWFSKTRHKHAGIRFQLEKNVYPQRLIKFAKSAAGYKIGLYEDEDSNDSILQIMSPKHRNRQAPEPVICPQCGIEWWKGDPDSSASHRKEHKRRMVYLDPKPLSAFTQERLVNSDAELVTCTSPKWKHFEIYERARAFKKEFQYDFVQWESSEGNNDPDMYGFLFANEVGAIVGACAFRHHINNKNVKYFGLQWIWICPKERRKGHLSSRWAKFRERFGNFIVEPPVSDAMKAFLENKGDLALLEEP